MRQMNRLRAATSTIGFALLAVTTVFILFVLAPFYGNGINLRSYTEIAGSQVDFKGYAPFAWPIVRPPATLLAIFSAALTPALSLVLGPLLVLSLALNWGHVRRSRRLLWVCMLAANAAILLLTRDSLELIRLWFND